MYYIQIDEKNSKINCFHAHLSTVINQVLHVHNLLIRKIQVIKSKMVFLSPTDFPLDPMVIKRKVEKTVHISVQHFNICLSNGKNILKLSHIKMLHTFWQITRLWFTLCFTFTKQKLVTMQQSHV